MGLFDFLKKQPPQTVKLKISTHFDDRIKIDPPSYAVSNPLKSANGLYPHEILMLSYYKKYAAGAEPARFWKYTYGVDDVPALLSKLEKLGFADGADLTEKGRQELTANEYVLYIHRNSHLGISMAQMSILVSKNPKDGYRNLIWGELNARAFECMDYQKWGELRNLQYSMYLFLMEEKRYVDAIHSLYRVAAFDVNTANYEERNIDIILPHGVVKSLRDLVVKLDLDEHDFIAEMDECCHASANVLRLGSYHTACITAAIVYGHPENVLT